MNKLKCLHIQYIILYYTFYLHNIHSVSYYEILYIAIAIHLSFSINKN